MALDTSYEVRLRREGEGERKSAEIKNGMTAKKKTYLVPGIMAQQYVYILFLILSSIYLRSHSCSLFSFSYYTWYIYLFFNENILCVVSFHIPGVQVWCTGVVYQVPGMNWPWM